MRWPWQREVAVIPAPQEPSPRTRRTRTAVTPQVGRYTALGYDAASTLQNVDQRYSGGNRPGWEHERFSRDKLIAQSRDFVRNNMLYRGIIERAIDFSIGSGFGLQADDDTVDALWESYITTAEVSGRYNGAKFPRAMAREFFYTGEAPVKIVSGLRLQLLESEQIGADGAISDSGIIYSNEGKAQSFRVYPWANRYTGQPTMVDARDMLFVVDYERPSSQRGMPVLQSVFPMLHRISDVCDAEALAWQMLSRIFLKHKSDSPTDPFATTATITGGLDVTELPYALVANIGADDDLESMARDIPGQDFPQTLTTFCRLLGLPLGIPLELILMDWTKSNYSQTKAALMLCWERFRAIQSVFLNDFYEPLFNRLYNSWVADGLIKDTPETRRHKFIPPQFPWIDALKEAQAYEKKLSLGLITHGETLKALESERKSVLNTREIEITDAINRANKIKEDTGVTVPWEYFAGLTVGKTEQAVRAGTDIDMGAGDDEIDKPEEGDEEDV